MFFEFRGKEVEMALSQEYIMLKKNSNVTDIETGTWILLWKRRNWSLKIAQGKVGNESERNSIDILIFLCN